MIKITLGVLGVVQGSKTLKTSEPTNAYGIDYFIIHKDSGKCLTLVKKGEKLGKNLEAERDTLDLRPCSKGAKKVDQLHKLEYNFSDNWF